jgi:hypothetical protein
MFENVVAILRTAEEAELRHLCYPLPFDVAADAGRLIRGDCFSGRLAQGERSPAVHVFGGFILRC